MANCEETSLNDEVGRKRRRNSRMDERALQTPTPTQVEGYFHLISLPVLGFALVAAMGIIALVADY